MAAEQLQSVSLKVLVEVDKEKNRVTFAESDKDFVDILFSFLTMPMGTIIRPLSNELSTVGIGCMNKLYESVKNLSVQHLRTEACKEMLLHPRSAAETHCRNLKLKINVDTEPTKYYVCTSESCRTRLCLLSTNEKGRCRCGQVMSQNIEQFDNSVNPFNPGPLSGVPIQGANEDQGGVFVKETASFMISNDLQVMPLSTITSLSLLRKLGISGGSGVEERTVNIGVDEVLRLLLFALISETPLTDVISLKQLRVNPIQFDSINTIQPTEETDGTSEEKKIKVKLMQSKSTNKVLYAEAKEDFVDLLVSFLTFPLGSVVELLGHNSPLPSVNNLYKSVKDLSVDDHMKSEECKNMLIHPKLAPHFSCQNQLLWIEEALHLHHYWFQCNNCVSQYSPKFGIARGADIAPSYCKHHYPKLSLDIVNPKLTTGDTRSGGGFMNGPAMFMVTDDLAVTRLSPISGITLLGKLKVPIIDIEERVVNVGKKEALSLLRASLISKTALTDVFNPKKPRQERENLPYDGDG